LWRIKNGEVPRSLNPKVFWLILGTNDLALGMCSEEVVTLGIMRVAEELHHLYPESIVVIQGILPRSNHQDGTLEGKTSKYAQRPGIAHGTTMTNNNSNNKPPTRKYGGGGAGGGGGGQRRSLLQDSNNKNQQQHHVIDHESFYNPMDQFLDNYLEHYDDPVFTNQLISDYWGPPMMMIDYDDDDDDEDSHPDSTMRQRRRSRHLQDLTTRTAGAIAKEDKEEEDDKAETTTSGGSIISTPKKDYTYDDNNKILPASMRAPLPRFDFYLWPSIKAINEELEGFCSKHDHFVYFDAGDLVLGSIGNSHYRAGPKQIIKALMPNYVHLSYLGHKVLLDVINDELNRIILDDDEANDIETKNNDGGTRN
jgi:hypothetical protein